MIGGRSSLDLLSDRTGNSWKGQRYQKSVRQGERKLWKTGSYGEVYETVMSVVEE